MGYQIHFQKNTHDHFNSNIFLSYSTPYKYFLFFLYLNNSAMQSS